VRSCFFGAVTILNHDLRVAHKGWGGNNIYCHGPFIWRHPQHLPWCHCCSSWRQDHCCIEAGQWKLGHFPPANALLCQWYGSWRSLTSSCLRPADRPQEWDVHWSHNWTRPWWVCLFFVVSETHSCHTSHRVSLGGSRWTWVTVGHMSLWDWGSGTLLLRPQWRWPRSPSGPGVWLESQRDKGVYTWLVTPQVGWPSQSTGQGSHIFGPRDHMDFSGPCFLLVYIYILLT